MPRKPSEHARWREIYFFPEPGLSEQSAKAAQEHHQRLRAVLNAFTIVGRVVRAVPSKYGNGIAFKARRG